MTEIDTQRADTARRAQQLHTQQTQQLQQQGSPPAAAPVAPVDAGDVAARQAPRLEAGARLLGGPATTTAPTPPGASLSDTQREEIYGATRAVEVNAANPERPAGQPPTSTDVDTALRQTGDAHEAALRMAERAGIDPSQVSVTNRYWETIERRAAHIEADRAVGITPAGWDGNPITPNQDARQVARDEVMAQRFGGRENWERVQASHAAATQAERDRDAPANDVHRVERAQVAQMLAGAFVGLRAGAGRLPRPRPATTLPVTAGVRGAVRPSAATQVNALPETIAARPMPARSVVDDWNRFLGPGQTTIHPRTGAVDPNRIFSADGTRSIRYGNHEMNSNPNKAHYHRETWSHNPNTDVMTVTNELVRISR